MELCYQSSMNMKLSELPRYDVNWHSEAHSIPVNLKAKNYHLNCNLTWHDPGYGNRTWKTEKGSCGQASFFQWCPSTLNSIKFLYGLSTCDIMTVTRILLSISKFQATEQKEYTHMLNKVWPIRPIKTCTYGIWKHSPSLLPRLVPIAVAALNR